MLSQRQVGITAKTIFLHKPKYFNSFELPLSIHSNILVLQGVIAGRTI